jgi:hypothetical protein
MKRFYFFFDRDNMPLAVFLCQVQEEAMHLFSRLYRQTWVESVESGITVIREDEVPAQRWNEIYTEYQSRRKVEEKPFVMPIVIPIKKHMDCGSVLLESSKYMW